jgi:hypothetical protein
MPFVEIDLSNQQQCGILFDLMVFGYNKKGKELRESDDEFKRELGNNPEKLIEHVIEFFKATGYSAKFNGFETMDNIWVKTQKKLTEQFLEQCKIAMIPISNIKFQLNI